MNGLPGVVPQNPDSEQHLLAAQDPTPGPHRSGSTAAPLPGIVTLQIPYLDWQPVKQ